MTIETIKALLDACYQAKRIRDLLPPLPKGVSASYIHYLDVLSSLERQGIRVKVSDISDALHLPRPGVTRTVKEMESKGYLCKVASPEDGRLIYVSATPAGRELAEKYITRYFDRLSPFLAEFSEEDVSCTIQTIERFYRIMSERRIPLE